MEDDPISLPVGQDFAQAKILASMHNQCLIAVLEQRPHTGAQHRHLAAATAIRPRFQRSLNHEPIGRGSGHRPVASRTTRGTYRP
jgi:hypothetical protein